MKVRISDLKSIIREELLRNYLLEEFDDDDIPDQPPVPSGNRGEVCIVCGRYAQPDQPLTRSKSDELVHVGDCQRVADTLKQSLKVPDRGLG